MPSRIYATYWNTHNLCRYMDVWRAQQNIWQRITVASYLGPIVYGKNEDARKNVGYHYIFGKQVHCAQKYCR